MDRRGFLKWAVRAGPGIAAMALSSFSHAAPENFHFVFSQLRYRGGDWDPHPQSLDPLLDEVETRTSIDPARFRVDLSPLDPRLFSFPFLFMAGHYEFEPFTAKEVEALRRYLSYGGFLFADDSNGYPGFGFDRSFREEMRVIFPGHELRRLPQDHSVYRSFYLLSNVGGRVLAKPYLEGISIDNWTPVIYSQNDLAGAWVRDKVGNWVHPVVPGGEAQRAEAFRTGVNIIVYALTADYKKDLIHHPFIRRRQNL